MEALRQTLSLLLGLPIDYYVLVDMAGFVDLVDALGGLDVYVTETMDVGFSPAREGEDPVVVTIAEPGNYHFDGHQALAFVRNRTGSSDSTGCGASAAPCAPWPPRSNRSPWHAVPPDRPGGAGEHHQQHPAVLPARPDRVRRRPGLRTTSPQWPSGNPYYAQELELPQPPHRGPGADPSEGAGGAGGGGDGGGDCRTRRDVRGAAGTLTAVSGGRAARRSRRTHRDHELGRATRR